MKVECRRAGGQASYIFAIFALATLVVAAAFAVDITHFVSTQHELQCAVDAGALAGAAHLNADSTDQATFEARTVTEKNSVDGVAVSNNAADTSVEVIVTKSTPEVAGAVTVTASRKIHCILSPLLGRMNETVFASATASGLGSLTQIPSGIAFPMALSIDATPETADGVIAKALHQYKPGDLYEVYFGSGNNKNAAFTSFTDDANNNYFKDAIDDALGLTTSSVIPSVNVGMNTYLSNGESAFNYILNDPQYSKILSSPCIIFPVIEGAAAFNQSRSVVGFAALKVTQISKERGVPIIKGVIVRPVVQGRAEPAYSGNYSQFLTGIAPLTVRLVR